MTRPKAAALDCRKCGACCVAETRGARYYVHLAKRDVARLPPKYKLSVVRVGWEDTWWANEAALGTKRTSAAARCVALRGTVGRGVRCDCYEQRPSLCRTFVVGGAGCLQARADAGLACGDSDV